MKSRFWPIISATVVLAFGSLLPVYAAENQVEAPSMETEIVEKETVQNLSASLVELSKDNQAITLVKEDIAKKEAAAKKAAEEKAAKEAAEKAAAEKAAAEKAAKEKEAAEKQAAEKQAAEQQEAAASSTPAGGRTITMESTAYSSDPADALGGGSVTATGQNLLTNPMAVAVDPSVIPLGTRLYVEGYGEAYAVDTGSAIQGNIIDVHFSTAAQCYSWGRRTVQVTILS